MYNHNNFLHLVLMIHKCSKSSSQCTLEKRYRCFKTIFITFSTICRQKELVYYLRREHYNTQMIAFQWCLLQLNRTR